MPTAVKYNTKRHSIIKDTKCPFGMLERSYSDSIYRFGFNGKERDDEIAGLGNSLNFGARIYDSRLGKFLSPDPWEYKYPWQSSYAFINNNPISLTDYQGKGKDPRIDVDKKNKTITIHLQYDFVKGKDQTEEEFNQAKAEYMRQIVEGLEGRIATWKGDNYTIHVNVTEGKGRHSITVNFNKSLTRSYARGRYEQYINPNDMGAVHETLHNFGLADRYHYTQGIYKRKGGVDMVASSYGYIPMSLPQEYDNEYYGNEDKNIMSIGDEQITTLQWKYIIKRGGEKTLKQGTILYRVNAGVIAEKIAFQVHSGKVEIGLYKGNTFIPNCHKGSYHLYQPKGKSSFYGIEKNKKQLSKPYNP